MRFQRVVRSAIELLFFYSGLIRISPLRWAFTALVVARRRRRAPAHARVSRRATIGLALRARTINQLRKRPAFRFSNRITDRFPEQAARALLQNGAFQEGVDVLARSGGAARSLDASLTMCELLFELAEFHRAYASLLLWYPDPRMAHQKALLELVVGDEGRAVPLLISAAREQCFRMRPHQNLAARRPQDYKPNDIDVAAGGLGLLYDAYNYVGQRVTHVGAGYLSAKLYAGALRAQRKLRTSWPNPSAEAKTILSHFGISLEKLRLLPAEWVTQIGHLALMDVHLRMRDMGWWNGYPVVLAPRDAIANHPMLWLFEGRSQIFSAAKGELFDQFSSLQRYCGMSFNAFEMPTGEIVPWSEAGAMMIRQWEAEGRGYPLREEFDRRIGSDDQVLDVLNHAKKQWGMGSGDWYVCLHLRDASYYGEARGVGQSHRNSEISGYLPLIKHVTKQGGWVIKMGGPNSPKFPKMNGLIDYARSPFKSEVLDLHLIRHARYFVGTTSGLSNVAVSFGVPSALVNCVTVDAQLWGDRVRFALKPVIDRSGRMLTQREITSGPWRWQLFGAEVMFRHGLTPVESTPDEVLETAKEVERLVEQIDSNGGGASLSKNAGEIDGLIQTWQTRLALPHFYGNSRPSLYYLHKHESDFLQD